MRGRCDAPNRDSVRATSAPADVLRKHHFSCDIWSSPLVITSSVLCLLGVNRVVNHWLSAFHISRWRYLSLSVCSFCL